MMPASPHVGAAVKPVNGTQEAEPLFDANPTHQKKQATQHHSTEVVAQPPADSFAKKAAQKGTFMREREGSARTAPSKRTSLRDEAAEEMASATPNGDQEAQKTSVNPLSGQHPQNVSPHPTSDEPQMQEKVQRCLDLLCIDGLRRSEDKEERLRTLLYELRHTKLPRRVMELMLTVAYTLDGELAQSSSGPSEAKKSAYALLLHRVKQQEDSEKQRTLQKEFDKRCSELIFLNTRIGELDDSDDESNDAELLDAIDMILFWFQWRRMEEGCHSVPNGKCASFIIGVCALMTDYAVAFENGREDLRYAGKLSRVLELAQASQSQCDYLVRRGAEEIDLATCSQRREGGGGTDLPEVATSADGENGAEQACAGTTIREIAAFARFRGVSVVLVYGFATSSHQISLPRIDLLHRGGGVKHSLLDCPSISDEVVEELDQGLWMVLTRGPGEMLHATPAFRWPLDHFLLPLQSMGQDSSSESTKQSCINVGAPQAQASVVLPERTASLRRFVSDQHDLDVCEDIPAEHLDYLSLSLEKPEMKLDWIAKRWPALGTVPPSVRRLLRPVCRKLRAKLDRRGFLSDAKKVFQVGDDADVTLCLGYDEILRQERRQYADQDHHPDEDRHLFENRHPFEDRHPYEDRHQHDYEASATATQAVPNALEDCKVPFADFCQPASTSGILAALNPSSMQGRFRTVELGDVEAPTRPVDPSFEEPLDEIEQEEWPPEGVSLGIVAGCPLGVCSDINLKADVQSRCSIEVGDVINGLSGPDGGHLSPSEGIQEDILEQACRRLALHVAAESGDEHRVVELLSNGSDVNVRDGEGRTALHHAVRSNHCGIITRLLDAGADVNATDRRSKLRHQGRTPLHIAARYGHAEAAALLLDRHAQIDKRKTDSWMPLHLAAKYDQIGVVGLLTRRGAYVDVKEREGWTPLHIASREGQRAMVAFLLTCGAQVDERALDGCTPLHLACYNGHSAVVSLLIDRAAGVDVEKGDACTPLHLASWNGHSVVVSLLLKKGAQIDKRDKWEATPLHLAAFQGHHTVALLLLSHGAPVDAVKQGGQTALHLAASRGHREIVKLLLENGADVDAVRQSGCTPIHLACERGQRDVVRLLLERNADVQSSGRYWSTPLHYACQCGDVDVAALLIDRGAPVDAKKHDGKTPLHLAAAEGHESAARLLLRNNAEVDAEDADGQTPLWLACRNGHFEVARTLIQHHADVEGPRSTDKSWTILFVACQQGHAEIVSLLLDHGANKEAKSISGGTPLYLAAWRGKAHVVRLLLSKSADRAALERGGETSLHVQALIGNLKTVQRLVERGAVIEAVNSRGSTPLTAAVCAAKLDVAMYLLDKGANIDAQITSSWCKGYSPLHHACKGGNCDMVKMLLDRGACAEIRDQHGRTPLRLAAQEGHLNAVQFLLDADANVQIDAKDREGRTALWIAARNGYEEIASLLLARAADVHATTWTCGATVLFAACQGGHLDVVHLLLGAKATVNTRDNQDRTPLYVAAVGGHDSVVAALLKHGADSTLQAKDGRTPLCAALYAGQLNIVRLLRGHHCPERDGLSELHMACVLGDLRRVRQLLSMEIDVDTPHEGRWSALDLAALLGRVELARLLLDSGADVSGKDPRGVTPLHSAAWWGKEEVARLLLEAGADINAKDLDGLTPLHFACQSGQVAVVSLLLDGRYGAAINAKGKCGDTPLHAASRTGKLVALRLLLEKGADLEAVTHSGATPLLAASRCGHAPSVKLLLDHGALVDGAPGLSDTTPLLAAAAQGRLDVVSLLLCRNARKATDNQKRTALCVAAEAGHKAVVRLLKRRWSWSESECKYSALELACIFGDIGEVREHLLTCNRGPLRADKGKSSVLELASRFGNESIVRLLLNEFGNSAGNLPPTALHTAAAAGHGSVVNALLETNVDLNARDYERRTALHLAASQNRVEVVELLLKAGGVEVNACDRKGQTALAIASRRGHSFVVDQLLRHGANPLASDEDGRKPLWWAAANGNTKTVTLLLQHGDADVECQRTSDGCTALLVACQGRFHNVVLELLRAGANVNSPTKDGRTPLMAAARSNSTSVATLLLRSQADINWQDGSGRTALHESAQHGHVAMVRLLVDNDAVSNVVCDGNATALHLAARAGHSGVVSILWTAGTRYLRTQITELHIACSLGRLDDVKALAASGADVCSETVRGCTPLRLACAAGHAGVVGYLLDHFGAALEGEREAALHVACAMGRTDAVAQLLLFDADIDAKDDSGDTPLSVAAANGWDDVVRLLLERGADTGALNHCEQSPLHVAAAHGGASVVSLLLYHESRSGRLSTDVLMPLRVAIRSGNEEVVHSLLRHCQEIDASGRTSRSASIDETTTGGDEYAAENAVPRLSAKGYRLIHLATKSGCSTTVRLLLDNGADVNGTAEKQVTALHIAVAEGNTRIAKLLLDEHADVNAAFGAFTGHDAAVPESRSGRQGRASPRSQNSRSYALHLAAQGGDEGMVRLLLDYGAGVNCQDSRGRSPLHFAVEGGHEAVVRLLLMRGAISFSYLSRAALARQLTNIAELLQRVSQQDSQPSSEPETETETETVSSDEDDYTSLVYLRNSVLSPPLEGRRGQEASLASAGFADAVGGCELALGSQDAPSAPVPTTLDSTMMAVLREAGYLSTGAQRTEHLSQRQHATLGPDAHWFYSMQCKKERADALGMRQMAGRQTSSSKRFSSEMPSSQGSPGRSKRRRRYIL